MPDQPIGQNLDNLGVTLDLDGDEIITDAVVITKIVDGTGVVRLGISTNDGISWIEQIGILTAAQQISSSYYRTTDNDT